MVPLHDFIEQVFESHISDISSLVCVPLHHIVNIHLLHIWHSNLPATEPPPGCGKGRKKEKESKHVHEHTGREREKDPGKGKIHKKVWVQSRKEFLPIMLHPPKFPGPFNSIRFLIVFHFMYISSLKNSLSMAEISELLNEAFFG